MAEMRYFGICCREVENKCTTSLRMYVQFLRCCSSGVYTKSYPFNPLVIDGVFICGNHCSIGHVNEQIGQPLFRT